MIEIKTVRNIPTFRHCPVCRERLAPKGSNVTVTIDAENEATAIEHITHKACAQTVIAFTRARGSRSSSASGATCLAVKVKASRASD